MRKATFASSEQPCSSDRLPHHLLGCHHGGLPERPLAWNFADITMGFMAIVNLIAILLLGKWAFKALTITRRRSLAKTLFSWLTTLRVCPQRSAGILVATI
ncbi:MAG: alanine:cation symporter family protein [Eggerthellaceae bacterium]